MDALALSRIFLSLLVVVLLILGCAWIARRNGLSGIRNQKTSLSISAKLPVGPRGMQVMVVNVEDARLVVGVTPGGINVLHTLPPQDNSTSNLAQVLGNTPPARTSSPSFQSIIRNYLRPNAN